MKVLLATRSGHKLQEIRAILRSERRLELVDLNAEGVPVSKDEDLIEEFDTFEKNAIAKATYFHRRTHLPTLADDSGIVVDALDGAPGVRSKRFAPAAEGATGEERDRQNLECLLEGAFGSGSSRADCTLRVRRGSRCGPGRGSRGVFRGTAEGLILGHGRGKGGFGYDPVFYDQRLGRTFAELTPDEKNAISHRGVAFRDLARHLSQTD